MQQDQSHTLSLEDLTQEQLDNLTDDEIIDIMSSQDKYLSASNYAVYDIVCDSQGRKWAITRMGSGSIYSPYAVEIKQAGSLALIAVIPAYMGKKPQLEAGQSKLLNMKELREKTGIESSAEWLKSRMAFELPAGTENIRFVDNFN